MNFSLYCTFLVYDKGQLMEILISASYNLSCNQRYFRFKLRNVEEGGYSAKIAVVRGAYKRMGNNGGKKQVMDA